MAKPLDIKDPATGKQLQLSSWGWHVVRGWKDRAEAAEARVAVLEEAKRGWMEQAGIDGKKLNQMWGQLDEARAEVERLRADVEEMSWVGGGLLTVLENPDLFPPDFEERARWGRPTVVAARKRLDELRAEAADARVRELEEILESWCLAEPVPWRMFHAAVMRERDALRAEVERLRVQLKDGLCPHCDGRMESPAPRQCPECGCSPECLKHRGKHEERCSRYAREPAAPRPRGRGYVPGRPNLAFCVNCQMTHCPERVDDEP
jgi:hypothetical protein